VPGVAVVVKPLRCDDPPRQVNDILGPQVAVLVLGVEYRAAGVEVPFLFALLRLAHALAALVVYVDVAVGIHSHLSGGFVSHGGLNARLRHLVAQVVRVCRGFIVSVAVYARQFQSGFSIY